MRNILRVVILVILLAGVAAACWMAPSPPTPLRSRTIAGRFTYEGKPLKRSRVELRGSKGVLLANTTTDANGRYRFASVKSGLYWVIMLKPSYEKFTIDFQPTPAEAESLDVNFYDDYCYTIKTSKQ